MVDVAEMLAAARAALGRCEWGEAWDGFRAVAEHAELDADDLMGLGSAGWWLGHFVEANRALREAHRRQLEAGAVEDAALSAIALAVDAYLRGDEAGGSGWIGRARRLTGDLPEGPIHGYVAYVADVDVAFGAKSWESVIPAARQVRDLGRRFADVNLTAGGLCGEGRALIRQGRTVEGVALLDEAMIAVESGELLPDWAGNLYCHTMAACHELADYARMARWTEATELWLDTLPPATVFAGICRVYRASLWCLQGSWERAEAEAERVCADLEGVAVGAVAEAFCLLGDLRRLRGDRPGAEAAYHAAHERGRDPQPGLALLRLAEGNVDAAGASLRAALIATPEDRLARARLLAAQVEIACTADQLEVARKASDELTDIAATYSSPGLTATAVGAAGIVAMAEGHLEEALAGLRDACRRWHELEVPYETARACVLLARAYQLLGNPEGAAMELDVAAETFTRLGATVDGAAVEAMRGRPRLPGGLTERETEVLALVAEGSTNQEVAARLFISPKTVARHLSNIFTKLDVRTRTQAARYAHENGLRSRQAPARDG